MSKRSKHNESFFKDWDKAIKSIPIKLEQPHFGKWSTVDKHKPPKDEYVWVVARINSYHVLQQAHMLSDGGKWYNQLSGQPADYYITHWMPYPDPPDNE